jgi:ABC-type cobalamin/Fe3+-siderophores transport system ATPase subunit
MDLSILMVSHDLSAAAAIADRMVFINNRSLLFEGTPAEVLQQPEVRNTFGLDVQTGGPELSVRTPPCPVNGGDAT